MAHILLVTIGSGGDIYPFMRIGKVLMRQGHRVTLITHCIYEKEALGNGFGFRPFDTGAEYRLTMNADIQIQIQEPKAGKDFVKKYIIPKMDRLFELTQSVYDGTDTLIVGHYLVHIWLLSAAERLRIPYLTVLLSPSFWEGADEAAAMWSFLSPELNDLRERMQLPPIRNWERAMRRFSHGLAFWPGWFAAKQLPAEITPAGFLLHPNSEEVPEEYRTWMEEERPVLITHATTPPAADSFFHASIESCEQLQLPAIVVTKFKDALPKSLPPMVKYAPALPFSKVMKFARLLIHHGGIGTLGQAMQAGIPQLVLGNGFDRPRNASYLRSLEAGEFLPIQLWNAEEVSRALTGLLSNPRIAAACSSFQDGLKEYDTDAIIAQTAERVIRDYRWPESTDEERAVTVGQKSSPALSQDKLDRFNALSPQERSILLMKLKARK